MPSTERRQRRIDAKLARTGGGAAGIAESGDEIAPPSIPVPRAPTNLTVTSTFLIFSAVTPTAGANLSWNAPSPEPDSYLIQWATSSSFTSPAARPVSGRQVTAGVDGLPVNTTVYVRIAAVTRGVQGAWSNTASTTTPNDTTPPAAPTSLSTSWSGLTGDLTISWTNPSSVNLRDVRLRIYSAEAGTLYREVYSTTGRYTWTRGQHFADVGSAYDPSVYIVLTARSWSGVFSATDLTGTATLAAPSTPSGLTSSWASDTGTAGANCLITWTAAAGVERYRLTIDGTARDVIGGRYDYSFAQNQAEHSGTADPVLSLSLVAVDALGQTSSAATGTATNAAPPATTISAYGAFSQVTLTIGASTAADIKDYRVRVYKDSSLVQTVYFSDTRPSYAVENGDGSYTFDVAARDMFLQVGTASSQTAAVALEDIGAFIDSLRSGAVYSDSQSTDPETLYDAYTDDNRSSGGVSYAANALWVRWIRFERADRDRYRTITLSMAPAGGTTNWYIRTSEDAATWSYFAGPVTSSRILTAVANAAAAQAAPVSAATLGNSTASRVDLPAITSARYIEVWVRNTTASTRIDEFYPRRVVQSDDIEAEAIKAVNIAAGAITADKISATAIDGITITGATIQTAASGERVVLDSTGLKTYDSGGNVVIEATTSTNGELRAGDGTLRLSRNGLNVVYPSGSASRTIFRFYASDGTSPMGGIQLVNIGNKMTLFAGSAPGAGTSVAGIIALKADTEIDIQSPKIRITDTRFVSNTAFWVSNTTFGSNVLGLFGGDNSGSGDQTFLSIERSSLTAGMVSLEAFRSGIGGTRLRLNSKFSGLVEVGNQLQVNGAAAINAENVSGQSLRVRGSGTGSSTYALAVVNSANSDRFWIRDDGAGWLAGTLTQASDARRKDAIRPLGPGLPAVLALQPRRFIWRDGPPGTQVGLIAQEAAAVLPDLVTEAPDGALGLNYLGLIPYLIAAVQELARRLPGAPDA